MTEAFLQFFLSAVVVAAAGVVLTRAADGIADLTGLGRLVVGSVLLAGATSLPELSVDLNAVRAGHDDLAVGDLLGSCLFNLLILAIADLVHRGRGRMLSRTAAAHAISATMSMLLAAVAGLLVLLRPGVAIGGVGIGSLIVIVAYGLGLRVVSFDQRFVLSNAEAAPELPSKERRARLRRETLRFAVASACIVVVAPWVAEAAAVMAERSGLGETFVGTTFVALTTSLPELVATLSAVRMGAFDLAVGNIFGSNSFNMAMLLPLDLASGGPLLSSVSPAHAVTAFWVVVVTSVAVIGQLYHVEKRNRLLEPDAVMVALLVLAALASLSLLGP